MDVQSVATLDEAPVAADRRDPGFGAVVARAGQIQLGSLLSGATRLSNARQLVGIVEMRSRLVRRSAQLIADFVIGSLLHDHQTAMAFATNHLIPVDDGDSARWARVRDCLAERSPGSQCGAGNGRTIAWTAHDDEFSSRDRSLASGRADCRR